MTRYLDTVQGNMNRQVVLEAKILEVVLNNHYQFGIDWKILGADLNALDEKRQPFPGTNIDNTLFPIAFTALIKWHPETFTSKIRALETQGNVQLLSSPRISTLNNQKAVIKVGTDEFFVTGVSTSETISGSTTTPTQDVQLTPFFSGITLDVTPQISANDEIILHIHPSISKVRDQQKAFEVAGKDTKLPLALSTIRETDTIVHAHSGQVIVIGGLMQDETREDIAGLPWFANVPFLGTLFRNTKQISKKSELVILLRPIVMHSSRDWNGELKHHQARLKSLERGFHVGNRPDLYGTEAEKPIQYFPPRHKHRHHNTVSKQG